MSKYDKLCTALEKMASGANTSCKDFTAVLKELGFEIKNGRKGEHRVATHAAIGLTVEDGANYNYGHNPGMHVKRSYIKKFVRICDEYEKELRGWLK